MEVPVSASKLEEAGVLCPSQASYEKTAHKHMGMCILLPIEIHERKR